MMRLTITATAVATTLLTTIGLANAEFPEKDITLIIGYAAGGGSDITARTMAPYLEKHLGGKVSIVIKNVPGAGGQIGLTQLSREKPDGYTIGHFNLPATVTRMYDRETAYTLDSFDYIAVIASDPGVLAASNNSNFKTLQDVIDFGKKEPGALTYAIPSLGGDDHLAAISFAEAGGVETTIVPFKGGGPTRTAIMGGHVSVGGLNIGEAIGFRDSLRMFAVMAEERSEFMPDVPTFKELGYDVVMSSTRGYAAPAGVPEEIKQKYYAAFRAMFQDQKFLDTMKKQGVPPYLKTGDDWKKMVFESDRIAAKAWKTSPWK